MNPGAGLKKLAGVDLRVPALRWNPIVGIVLKEVNVVFSPVVTRQWAPARAHTGTRERPFVVVDAALGEEPSVSLIHVKAGPSVLVLSPASVFHSIVKEGIDIAGGPSWLRKHLRKTEVTA